MIARTYLNIDNDKALENYLIAKPLLEKVNFTKVLIAIYNDLGDLYKNLNASEESIKYYDKSLKLLENTNDLLQSKITYKGLSSSYVLQDNYKEAYKFQSLYLVVKDSLFNEENIKSINLLQKQFETEKKNKEIAEQQLQLNQKETEIQKRNTQIIYMSGIVIFLLVLSLLTGLYFKQKQKRKNQEILTLKREYQIKSLESLIEGEEKERFRIAKELHDGVNGDLSAIKYKLSSLLEMNNKVIKEAITMIDDSCEQVRAISHNLVPPSLENFNLVEATENYCENLNAVNRETVTFQHVGEHIHMSKKAEVNAFRIIQELVSNALKHANAKEINVQLSHREGVVQITVEDDGVGFDKDSIESEGIGLSNIQSRIDYLNAEMDLISNDQGTSCTIDIDLNKLNDN